MDLLCASTCCWCLPGPPESASAKGLSSNPRICVRVCGSVPCALALNCVTCLLVATVVCIPIRDCPNFCFDELNVRKLSSLAVVVVGLSRAAGQACLAVSPSPPGATCNTVLTLP